MKNANLIDIELVIALTVLVRRTCNGEPTLKDVECAADVIRNALEIVTPADARSNRMARSLETTFELTADAAGAEAKRVARARRAAGQKTRHQRMPRPASTS